MAAPPPPSTPARILGRLRALLVQLFTENLHYKALSLLVAVGIWGWLQLEQVVMVQHMVRVPMVLLERFQAAAGSSSA